MSILSALLTLSAAAAEVHGLNLVQVLARKLDADPRDVEQIRLGTEHRAHVVVGDQVKVRDEESQPWVFGVVTREKPLLVRPDNSDKDFPWNYVEKIQSTAERWNIAVGSRVRVRDREDQEWQVAMVTSVDPFRAKPDYWPTDYAWNFAEQDSMATSREVLYLHSDSSGGCGIEGGRFHERCSCDDESSTFCAERCDEDVHCVGHVGNPHGCQYATTSTCAESCSKFNVGNVGAITTAPGSGYDGCHVKLSNQVEQKSNPERLAMDHDADATPPQLRSHPTLDAAKTTGLRKKGKTKRVSHMQEETDEDFLTVSDARHATEFAHEDKKQATRRWVLIADGKYCSASVRKPLQSGSSIEQCQALAEADPDCDDVLYGNGDKCRCVLVGKECDFISSGSGNNVYQLLSTEDLKTGTSISNHEQVVRVGNRQAAEPMPLKKTSDEAFKPTIATPSATTQPTCGVRKKEGQCMVWGDPHIITFDLYRKRLAQHPKREAFLRTHNWKTQDSQVQEEGTYWLVKSTDIHIQGRYSKNKTHPKLTRLSAIAVGGPFMDGNTLIFRTSETGKVTWNDQEILSDLPSEFVNQFVHAQNHKDSELVKNGKTGVGIDVQLPRDVKLTVNRGKHNLAVKIRLCQQDGLDGQCGNFNSDHKDDTTENTMLRMGRKLSPQEFLFEKFSEAQ